MGLRTPVGSLLTLLPSDETKNFVSYFNGTLRELTTGERELQTESPWVVLEQLHEFTNLMHESFQNVGRRREETANNLPLFPFPFLMNFRPSSFG